MNYVYNMASSPDWFITSADAAIQIPTPHKFTNHTKFAHLTNSQTIQIRTTHQFTNHTNPHNAQIQQTILVHTPSHPSHPNQFIA